MPFDPLPHGTPPSAASQLTGLSVRGVSKRYGRRPVLRDVSVDVPAGRSLAVVGANGCGKSTLLRICAGLVAPDTGTVAVHGTVGYCPQDAGLDGHLTAEDHLAWFGRGAGMSRAGAVERGRRIAAALDWDIPRRRPVRHLSGGTRQKLNVTAATLTDPGVVLLDEPYQGFDHGSYLDLWDLVARWCDAGSAVVVVTHLLHELDRVDAVLDLSAAEA